MERRKFLLGLGGVGLAIIADKLSHPKYLNAKTTYLVLLPLTVRRQIFIPEYTTPHIIGDEVSIFQTREALSLLQNRASFYFNYVIRRLGVVDNTVEDTRIYPAEDPVRATISSAARAAGDYWFASILVHESKHSQQFRDYKFSHPAEVILPSVTATNQAEWDAITTQIDSLVMMKAPSYLIDFARDTREGYR